MYKNIRFFIYIFSPIICISLLSSCANTKKVAYFNDVKDSARITSASGLEPIIQKKDILSVAVSSLSSEAT
ncbi:MAG TPA: hypothetical protein VIM07_15960, partial [Chitinophagaceae bacterium]